MKIQFQKQGRTL